MKPKRDWTIQEAVYATQRSILNELKKANVTLDSLLRIEMQRFDPRDYGSSDDDQL